MVVSYSVSPRQARLHIRLQDGNAQIAVQQARGSYRAAVSARKLQAQALDVEQARYDDGVDPALILIQFQRNLAQARSAEVAALGIYAKAKAALIAPSARH